MQVTLCYGTIHLCTAYQQGRTLTEKMRVRALEWTFIILTFKFFNDEENFKTKKKTNI